MNVKLCSAALLFFIIKSSLLFAQSSVYSYWDVEVSYEGNFSDEWSYEIELSARNFIIEQGRDNLHFQHVEFPYLKIEYALTGGTEIGVGYKSRWAQPFFEKEYGYEHRFLEQIEYDIYITNFKLENRFRVEQRVRRYGLTNRLRHELAHDFPLRRDDNGRLKNYLSFSEEVLFSFNSVETKFENYFFAGVGWKLSAKTELETGIEYKLEHIGPYQLQVFELSTSLEFGQ